MVVFYCKYKRIVYFCALNIKAMRFIKHGVAVSLSRPRKNGDSSVVLRVTCGGKRDDLHSGICLSPKQWNEKKGRVRHGVNVNGVPYNVLNDAIDEQVSFIHDYFNGCAMRDEEASLSDLKARFNMKFKTSASKSTDEFFYLFDKFISVTSETKRWGEPMIEAFTRLRERLYRFKPDLKFSDLSEELMNKFLRELSTTMYNDAIEKRLSYLRQFVKWAESRNYGINKEFFGFSPKLPKAKKEVRYLTLEELERIKNCDIRNGTALSRVRDFFLFQCHTALRYSDLKQLKKSNIIARQDGGYNIRVLTEKDDDYVTFKLSKLATAIYLKYRDTAPDEGALFPVISNQKYNEALKELGKKAKLQGEWVDYEYKLSTKIEVKSPKSDIASHTARRTFIVTAMNEGVSLELIAAISSHSDFNAMKPYIKANTRGTDQVIDVLDKATGEV